MFSVLFICSCGYVARIPMLKGLVLRDKHGLRGTFYKAAVLGIRLHYVMSILCVLAGLYRLFF